MAEFQYPPISFQTHPSQYRHWKVQYDNDVAHVILDVNSDRPMWEDRYELKSNSYDLSVDIELNDITQRMRFEHPEIRAVLVESSQDKLFCAGANIPMLGGSPHAFKVNFCKYTNETRCSIEDASAHSGQIWIAALNGTAAGGGYELALACEYIYLIDDGNSAVSLPEVPLLGVLPGTGGLTRLTDKRKIRRDISDLFCTKAEGFRARDAKKYRLIDGSFPRSKWSAGMEKVARDVASKQTVKDGPGIQLPTISSQDDETSWTYNHIRVGLDEQERCATITIQAPTESPERSATTWSLAMFRDLEDALLRLRFNHLSIGLILFKSEGDPQQVKVHEEWVSQNAPQDWFVQEILFLQKRTLRKIDNMSKSLFALIEEGHCFVGTLFEVCLACDRSYMFLDDDLENTFFLTEANKGRFLMSNGNTRLQQRYLGDADLLEDVLGEEEPIDAEQAEDGIRDVERSRGLGDVYKRQLEL